jgi:hypothetical protein
MPKKAENKIPIAYIPPKMFNQLKKGKTVMTKMYEHNETRGDGTPHKNIRVKLDRIK